jgi:hypothetical protein
VNAGNAIARALPAWPGWRHLPRDARDTLFLLGVIAWTVLPHVPQLPLWCSLLTAIVLLWRARLAVANAPLPRRWVLVVVLLVVGGLTVWSHHTLLGKEAGITLVVAMMALKTLELRARRDAFVVFFLGFFIVLTQFLHSQSLLVALAMLGSVWGLLTALVLAHMPVGQPAIAQAGRLAARAALLGAPVMVLLFVLFPRIGPLWGLPQDAAAKTGLSNTMVLGSVAQLALDDSVALRLRFDGALPPRQALYLRGPVLSTFDGREWRRLDPSAFRRAPARDLRVAGAPLTYEMTLEPLRTTVLPLLEMVPDTPEAMPRIEDFGVQRRQDQQWTTERPITERLRFKTQAHLEFRHGPTREVPALQELRALPAGFNPRTLAWSQQWRDEAGLRDADAHTLAQALLGHIARGGFVYTLEPGTYGRDAVDEFWLDRKRGFCEHLAAAFVVVMRSLGVPARIVTGYQGADDAPVDGFLIVRNSYAHAWAEYWQPAVGWVRVDPTAAVAPDRVGASRFLAPQPGIVAGAIGAFSPTLLAQLRSNWEALNNRWNQWVLNYSRGQQLDLLERLGVKSPGWEDLAYMLAGSLILLSLAGAAWAWWDRRRQDPWARLHALLRAELHRLGLLASPHQPLRTLAHRIREQLGADGAELVERIEVLDQQRYGRSAVARPPPGWSSEFRRAARRLQPAPLAER